MTPWSEHREAVNRLTGTTIALTAALGEAQHVTTMVVGDLINAMGVQGKPAIAVIAQIQLNLRADIQAVAEVQRAVDEYGRGLQ